MLVLLTKQELKTAFKFPGGPLGLSPPGWIPQACLSFFLAGLHSPRGPLRTGMRGASNSKKVPLWTLERTHSGRVWILGKYVWQM